MDTYDKSVPGMKITEVGTPDARLLRQWAADPKNMMCWGLDRVADRLEASESYAIHLKAAVTAMLQEWPACDSRNPVAMQKAIYAVQDALGAVNAVFSAPDPAVLCCDCPLHERPVTGAAP